MLPRILLFILLLSVPVYAQTPIRANRQIVKSSTATSNTVVTSDAGKLLTFNNASAVAVSIPRAISPNFPTDWFVDVKNLGAGSVTITPTTSTIGGSSTLVLTTDQSARIISNGTNWLVTATGSSGSSGLADPGSNGLVKRTSANVTAVAGASDLPTAIDAAKLADGSVSNAEFQRLGTVTSDVQTQLDGKQPLDSDLTVYASITPSANVQTLLGAASYAAFKSSLSLNNVDNTSDANKPVSTAQQTALDLKANLASPALTGTPTAPTAAGGTNTTQIATTAFVTAGSQPLDSDLTAFAAKTAPSGTVVGTTDSQILTTKTIDGDDNTVQDLPYSSIKSTSRSGDGTKLITLSGSATSGRCGQFDASGNLAAAAAACGSGGTPAGSDTQLQRNASSSFGGISGATSDGTDVTFGSGNLKSTRPKITTSIDDANGNEVIKTPATSSAVNEITVTNSATGNAPSITATGGDTNISLTISPKGSGQVNIGDASATTSYLTVLNSAAPSTPASGSSTVYVKTTDKVLNVLDDAGNASVTVRPDTGASNNFLTAISAAGVVSKAQPSAANLSNGTTGSNEVVLKTSPTLVAPVLGAATGTSLVLGAGSAITSSGAGGVLGTGAFANNALQVVNLLGAQTIPDSSGNVFLEPYPTKATNDFWKHTHYVFNDTATDDSLYGTAEISACTSGSLITMVWTSTATTNNIRYTFSYRVITADDTNSLDQTTSVEDVTITDTAPGAVNRRMSVTFTPTNSNFTTAGTLEWKLTRTGSNGGDTMAAAAQLVGLKFTCTP